MHGMDRGPVQVRIHVDFDGLDAFAVTAVNGGGENDDIAAPAVDFDPAFDVINAEAPVRVERK